MQILQDDAQNLALPHACQHPPPQARRARKAVGEARLKRCVGAVVAVIVGAIIAGFMVFGGLHAEKNKKSEYSYTPSYPSYSSDDEFESNPFEDYLDALDRAS